MNSAAAQPDVWSTHGDALALRLAEHLLLTGVALGVASAAGILLAIATYHRPFWRGPLLAAAGMLQTVPGIALLVMLMALWQRIGTAPALSALALYALLPIVQNTLLGLTGLPPSLAEAARGLGLSRWQRLRYVRLPLALPMILAGIRIAAVQTVGLATLAAFVGAGGLGQFINRGLFLSDTPLILLGAIPAALLALLIHGLLGLLARAAQPGRSRRSRRLLLGVGAAALAGLVLFTAMMLLPRGQQGAIVVGSKNFTEQWIVAEMIAQQIEQHTELRVERRFGLGGSSVLHAALLRGDIDLAVEYTGTALAAILHQPTPRDHGRIFPQVAAAYEKQFGLHWFAPLGFNNSYVLAIRSYDPNLKSVYTVSQLAERSDRLRAAFDFEFAERADGYEGLRRRYGLRFARVSDMHPDLLYEAMFNEQADVISAYATDGRLIQRDLRPLRDDRHFFPPYDAAVVARDAVLRQHPELAPLLEALSGKLTDGRMRELNARVESGEWTVEQAARHALMREKPKN